MVDQVVQKASALISVVASELPPLPFLELGLTELFPHTLEIKDGLLVNASGRDQIWDAYLEATLSNPWAPRRSSNHEIKSVSWEDGTWDDFAQFVARHPDSRAVLALSTGDEEAPGPFPAIYSLSYSFWPTQSEAEISTTAGHYSIDMTMVVDAKLGSTFPDAWECSLVRHYIATLSERYTVSYAGIIDDDLTLRTGWEMASGANLAYSIDKSMEWLRGYSWATYCPSLILQKIGGAEYVRSTGVFHEVRDLGTGLVELLATRTPAEYGLSKVAEVHAVLEPLLQPGTPRPRHKASRHFFIPQAAHMWVEGAA